MKARPLTKENVAQMRRNALAMVAKSDYLDYRSKQLELCNNIASVVHLFGIHTCVRTVWFFDHSDEDLSLHLSYNKPTEDVKFQPDASTIYVFFPRYSADEHKAGITKRLNEFFDQLEQITNHSPFKK